MPKICEDAGPLNTNPVEGSEQKERHSNSSNKTPECPSKDKDDNIIISPEDIPDEYEHNEDFTSLFVLFNHEKFVDQDVRDGSSKDQEDLIDCLSRLRYEIRKDLLCKDYTKKQIEDKLNEIVQMDHSKRNSLIVVFLTHGGQDGILSSSDNDFITCQEVWNLFTADKCPSLKGKPKIFIFQACKGKEKSKIAPGVQVDSLPRVEMAKKYYTIPAEADILVAYSTFEGNVSFRHPLSGSWFIQELCKNFTAYGRRDDILTIFMRISKCVAHHYQHKDYKQMPCFISTLTRKFYLCKSKERSYVLDLLEQNKKLLETVLKMQEKLETLTLKKEEESKEGKTG